MICSWTDGREGANSQIYARSLLDTVPECDVSQSPGSADNGAVAIDSSGNAAYVWQDQRSSSAQLDYRANSNALRITITGQVTSTYDGSPIAGASVHIGTYSAITDSGGSYTVSGIPPDAYGVTVSSANYVTVATALTIASSTQTINQDFSLNPLSTVTGHVYCSCDNSPLIGVTVNIGPYSATTDSSGSYAIIEIVPDTYSTSLAWPNYTQSLPPITVGAQCSPIANDVTITPNQGQCTVVSGHVTCSCDNSPITGVTVRIGQYSAATDNNGGYSISGVQVGTYPVTISGPNYDTVITPPMTISSLCAPITSDFALGSLPADALAKSLVFLDSLDGISRSPWQVLGKFLPANGMSLQQAACVLGVDHFNWIQTITHPPYIHYFLTFRNIPLPVTPIPDNQAISDPCPVIGMAYYIRSDLSDYWQLNPNANELPGDGSGFYWNEGAEANLWHRDNEHSLVFKDTPKLPNGFLTPDDGQDFLTRLVGVRAQGGYAFVGQHTGFTWSSDAVCDPQGAIDAGNVYGIFHLKETNDFSAVPVVSGGVSKVNYVPELESVLAASGLLSFTWHSLPGFTFQVQYTTNLSKANWVNLGSPVTGTNTVFSETDAIGPEQQRFYRVQQQ